MKSKDQNSSYDGFDTRKIFIPFNSMRRDFPNKPPAVEHTVDACWSLRGPLPRIRIVSASCGVPSRVCTASILATKKLPASGTR